MLAAAPAMSLLSILICPVKGCSIAGLHQLGTHHRGFLLRHVSVWCEDMHSLEIETCAFATLGCLFSVKTTANAATTASAPGNADAPLPVSRQSCAAKQHSDLACFGPGCSISSSKYVGLFTCSNAHIKAYLYS